MEKKVKSCRLYLQAYPVAKAKLQALNDHEIVDFAYQIGFDFTLEQWLAGKAEPIDSEETYEPPKGCGCGW